MKADGPKDDVAQLWVEAKALSSTAELSVSRLLDRVVALGGDVNWQWTGEALRFGRAEWFLDVQIDGGTMLGWVPYSENISPEWCDVGSHVPLLWCELDTPDVVDRAFPGIRAAYQNAAPDMRTHL
jgi:hypothetical protein